LQQRGGDEKGKGKEKGENEKKMEMEKGERERRGIKVIKRTGIHQLKVIDARGGM